MTNKNLPARDSRGRYVSAKGGTKVAPAKALKARSTKKAVVKSKAKNYIGISRDHSGSMSSIATAAARDYNNNINSIREANEAEKQDTIVSVVKCGVNSALNGIEREISLSTVSRLQALNENYYGANGSYTPLFDSVGDLIEQFESVPDAKDPNVSFLIMVITDGQNNRSYNWDGPRLARKIAELQATDHWTFIFRVPRPGYGINYKQDLVRMGIPEGNILEWDQTTRGVEVASQATNVAFRSFYKSRSLGATSSKGFYTTDMSAVSKQTVKAKLQDISNEVEFFSVAHQTEIRPFVESQTGDTMVKGGAFYQLTKKEDEVQDYKQIAIRDKKSGKVYSGVEARNILGLPHNGTVKVAPGNHGAYDIFIQSTSVNRKLLPGTQVLYWPKVGTAYQS